MSKVSTNPPNLTKADKDFIAKFKAVRDDPAHELTEQDARHLAAQKFDGNEMTPVEIMFWLGELSFDLLISNFDTIKVNYSLQSIVAMRQVCRVEFESQGFKPF